MLYRCSIGYATNNTGGLDRQLIDEMQRVVLVLRVSMCASRQIGFGCRTYHHTLKCFSLSCLSLDVVQRVFSNSQNVTYSLNRKHKMINAKTSLTVKTRTPKKNALALEKTLLEWPSKPSWLSEKLTKRGIPSSCLDTRVDGWSTVVLFSSNSYCIPGNTWAVSSTDWLR